MEDQRNLSTGPCFCRKDLLTRRVRRTVQIFELFEIIGGSDWAGHDKFRADLERSLPILRSCYFIADSVDLVHILVTENRIRQKPREIGPI
jgi:hypothetical protein